jgi:hypothetical protein
MYILINWISLSPHVRLSAYNGGSSPLVSFLSFSTPRLLRYLILPLLVISYWSKLPSFINILPSYFCSACIQIRNSILFDLSVIVLCFLSCLLATQ